MWSVVLTLVGIEDAPFKVFDSKSEAEEFRDEVEKAMDYERLIRFERNGREYTVDGAHIAMVEMYQAYRAEKEGCNRTPESVYAEMWARMMRLHMSGPTGDFKEDRRTCECMGWPDLVGRMEAEQ